MKKLSTNLLVAIAAFLMGLASASALHHDAINGKVSGMIGSHLDPMGNICAIQD